MTSTSFNVGLTADRASSKVLKPPGGGTSDIFGGSETAEKPVVRKKSVQTSSIVLDDSVKINGPPVENGHCKQGTCNERLFGPPLESNLCNSVAKTNGTNGEIITNGNDHTDAAATVKTTQPMTNGKATNGEVKNVAPTASRQRVPPGGFSSGLW